MTDEISIEQNVAGHPVVFPYSEPISLGPISLELRVDPSGDIVLPMDPSFSWRVLATNTVKRPTAEAYFAEHPDDPLGMATPAAVVRGDGIYLPKDGLAELHIPPADDLVLRVSHNAALFQFIQRTAHRGADSSRIGGSIDVPPADPEYYRAHGVLLPPAIVDEETLEEILANATPERKKQLIDHLAAARTFRSKFRVVDRDALLYATEIQALSDLEAADGQIKEIGAGAMGRVVKLWDVGLRVMVAAKYYTKDMVTADVVRRRAARNGMTISKEISGEDARTAYLKRFPGDQKDVDFLIASDYDNIAKRFLREGEIARRVHSMYVVPIRESFATVDKSGNDMRVTIMDYVPGDTLQNLTQSTGKQEPLINKEEIRRVLLDALRGIHDLSTQRIIHCDIKPANIMVELDKAGRVKEGRLIDLGVATDSNKAIGGTQRYSSPECIAMGGIDTSKVEAGEGSRLRSTFHSAYSGPDTVTPAADVFSWAVTAYAALLRHANLGDYNDLPPAQQLWYRVARNESLDDILKPLVSKVSGYNTPLEWRGAEVLKKALVADPAKRATAAELIPLWEQVMRDAGGAMEYFVAYRELMARYGLTREGEAPDGRKYVEQVWDKLATMDDDQFAQMQSQANALLWSGITLNPSEFDCVCEAYLHYTEVLNYRRSKLTNSAEFEETKLQLLREAAKRVYAYKQRTKGRDTFLPDVLDDYRIIFGHDYDPDVAEEKERKSSAPVMHL